MKKRYIISLKVNSDSKKNEPLSLAAVIYDTEWGAGRIVSDYIPGAVDLSGNATKEDMESAMLSATARVYKKFADKTAVVIIHNPDQYSLALESNLFTSMLEHGLIDELPTLIDVGTLLLQLGEETNSIDSYIKKNHLVIDHPSSMTEILSQPPLFDAYAILSVYLDLQKLISTQN